VLTPFDHALALILAVLFPIRARAFGFGRLERAAPQDLGGARLGVYRGAMIAQWSLSAVTLALWAWRGRAWRWLGLVPVMSGGLAGVLLGLVLVIFVVVRQRASGLRDDRTVETLRRRMQRLERMLPRTPGELGAFYALSFTAGVCEELLYRGYLIWYLQELGLALIPAAAVSSVIFGFGHLYQGPRGIALTAAVGGFLAAVYLLSLSLFAGMLFHMLMDVYSGHLLYTVYRREDAERAAAADASRAPNALDEAARGPAAAGDPSAAADASASDRPKGSP
jgi:membrane protease YdiL (CAAX protease family)